MTVSGVEVEQKACFKFKANFLPCTVLQITRYDWEALEQQLITALNNAPPFFTDLPVIIDLEKVKTVGALNFVKLKEILLANRMIPVGVRGGSEEQHLSAIMMGMPTLTAGRTTNIAEPTKPQQQVAELKEELKEEPKEEIKEEPAARMTKLVTTPIRSGMQVYAKDSDLIVTAAVSQGAEVLADGNIHVYGSLRGRVLAGVQGNLQARIYCRSLDAELVSIAGYYLTKDDILNSPLGDGMKQIYLENEQVRIDVL